MQLWHAVEPALGSSEEVASNARVAQELSATNQSVVQKSRARQGLFGFCQKSTGDPIGRICRTECDNTEHPAAEFCTAGQGCSAQVQVEQLPDGFPGLG